MSKELLSNKSRKKGSKIMSRKIAIPTVGDQVNPHFGRSEAFTLLTIEDQKVTSQEIIATADYNHQHEGIAQLLKSKKVETVICGGIGPGAIAGLENAGIEVLRGASGSVISVAESYAAGTFVSTSTVCNHHHHDHGHGHHDQSCGHHHQGGHSCGHH